MRVVLGVLAVGALLVASAAAPETAAAQAAPVSLDELLSKVKRGWDAERVENQRREAEFRKARDRQGELLAEAKARLAREEQRSRTLEESFEANEVELARLEETLGERLGTLGELFGVVRQVAGDAAGHVQNSLVSAQYPGRSAFLEQLAQSKSLPSIEELERLWYTLQQEMTESGKVVRFTGTVITPAGEEVERRVVRVGTFNAVSEGEYLVWDPSVQQLAVLKRQPASRYRGTVRPFESATKGRELFALDPSRGSILSLIVDTPDARERIAQGGPIGYTILVIGGVAGLLAIARWVQVLLVGRSVAAQQKRDTPDPGNPLGRILSVGEKNRGADPETLELKLDEAILRESGSLRRFLWVIKVVSVVAPLLGLLGTVTGMIETFQAITLFGTGDPKLMASGISEALVTTMLGLFVAIPLVLLHAVVSSGSGRIIEVLEEQSAGIVAARAEGADAVV